MPVRTKQLAILTTALTAARQDVYTVPAGHRTIWKTSLCRCIAVGAANFIGLGVTKAGVFRVFVQSPAVAAGSHFIEEYWKVLDTGDTLSLAHGATSQFTCLFSGTELQL